ncbi:MAG: aminotransferase class I/II-fold pyridoxal phosphate-dependent enzyme [Solirubrobacteraceae bacterium]
MEIRPFALERFYERWEFKTELMLSNSDCESLSVADLLELEPDAEERLLKLRLGYTEVPGSHELRAAVASRYRRIEVDDVLALAAAEEGIFLAYHALLRPADHVVVEAPCYGAAVEVARSTGATVSLWQRRYADDWSYDLDELERLLRVETKLIYVNTPHNPTGTQMPRSVLEHIVGLACERGIVLLCDEVYQGLEHDPTDRLPAACDLYRHAITLNTVSKAYGLPGLRIGWMVSRDPVLIERIRELKLYTTICSSAPSDLLVALAVRHGNRLVERSRQLTLANLPIVDAFFKDWSELFEWVRPTAGPIGFPRVAGEFNVHAWCEETAAQANVLLLPGSVYEEPRHVRIGFGRTNLPQVIDRLDQYLRTVYAAGWTPMSRL